MENNLTYSPHHTLHRLRYELNRRLALAVLLSFATVFLHPRAHAEDIIVDIGRGSGAAGSQNNSVSLLLNNTSDSVKGVQVYICDEGNYLTVRDCAAIGRASNLSCLSNECNPNTSSPECRRFPGCANIVLYSSGDVIKEGTGPIVSIKYDVSEDAPSGCFDLVPKGAGAKGTGAPGPGRLNELKVMSDPGQFCISESSGADSTTSTGETPATTSIASPADDQTEGTSGDLTPRPDTQSPRTLSPGRQTPLSGKTPDSLETPFLPPDGSAGRSSSRRSEKTPTGTTTSITAASSPSRLVISPSASVINSKGVVVLGAQTIAGGREVPGRYTWEIIPPSTIGSSIDPDGVFTAGNNTSSSPVEETIRVTDTTNRDISATATITIEGLQAPPEGCALSLSPSSADVVSGSIITFTASKLGRTCDEGTYQWKVNSKIGSTITAEGVYTAGFNPHPTPAIDIVMIKEGSLTADALLTVQPNEETNPSSSSPHDTPPAKRGSLHPGVLITMAVLLSAPGILLLRKKLKR